MIKALGFLQQILSTCVQGVVTTPMERPIFLCNLALTTSTSIHWRGWCHVMSMQRVQVDKDLEANIALTCMFA
jgi:hypothetical protein